MGSQGKSGPMGPKGDAGMKGEKETQGWLAYREPKEIEALRDHQERVENKASRDL